MHTDKRECNDNIPFTYTVNFFGWESHITFRVTELLTLFHAYMILLWIKTFTLYSRMWFLIRTLRITPVITVSINKLTRLRGEYDITKLSITKWVFPVVKNFRINYLPYITWHGSKFTEFSLKLKLVVLGLSRGESRRMRRHIHPAKKVFEHLRYFVSKNLY